ncbi:MAG: type II toxin-antitoxin system VapB family antitoxin, partial [Nitrospirota bacterium]|nr:type II toxin-antitoxin system VapB family antitoxin [Nitrospirota bacterium]
MRTNIVLDDETVKTAFRYSKAKTKKELINEALKELITSRQRLDLRDLRGKIEFRSD